MTSSARLKTGQCDRAIGLIIGTAAGAGFEFAPPAAPQDVFKKGGGLGSFEPVEWTDGTCMAAPLLRALANRRAVAPDVGSTTAYALDHVDPAVGAGSARDATAVLFARSGMGLGHGSLLRAAPLMLGLLDDPRGLAFAARSFSEVTHGDPDAADTCLLWTLARSETLRHARFDLRAGLDLLAPGRVAMWWQRIDEAEQCSPPDFVNSGVHDHVWLIDSADAEGNLRLALVAGQAVSAIARLRTRGRVVYVHCVEARSRTPLIASLYAGSVSGRSALDAREVPRCYLCVCVIAGRGSRAGVGTGPGESTRAATPTGGAEHRNLEARRLRRPGPAAHHGHRAGTPPSPAPGAANWAVHSRGCRAFRGRGPNGTPVGPVVLPRVARLLPRPSTGTTLDLVSTATIATRATTSRQILLHPNPHDLARNRTRGREGRAALGEAQSGLPGLPGDQVRPGSMSCTRGWCLP